MVDGALAAQPAAWTRRWSWGGALLLPMAGWLAGVGLQLQQATLSHPLGYRLAVLAGALGLLGAWWGLQALARARSAPLGSAPNRPPSGTPGGPSGDTSAAAQAWPWWPFALALCLAALAWGSTGWRAETRLAHTLHPALEGADLLIEGVVTGLPQRGGSGTRFMVEVVSASWRGQPVAVPPRLSLAWYAGFDDIAWMEAPGAELAPGQRWQWPVRLKRPHGLMNPHGFDMELRWFEQGVGAQGHVRVVRGGPAARRLAEGQGQAVDRLRDAVRQAIWRQVPDARVAGVLAALAVGDQAAIERADWELFRATGIAHLVSISGVHVTMFAWLAAGLVGWAWRRWPRGMLWWPAPLAGAWAGVVLAAGYALLAGWGVPAQRTLWMLVMVHGLRGAGLRWPWPLVLLAAACGVTALDPWAWLQAGFWLSFCAVGLLLAAEPGGQRPPGGEAGWLLGDALGRGAGERRAAGPSQGSPQDDRAAEPPGGLRRHHWAVQARGWLRAQASAHLRAQAVATVGLAPLSLLFFQQLSLVGFVANLVAIPLVTLLVTPLALAGMLWAPLWSLAGWGVQALVGLLSWLAEWPWAMWTAAAAPTWAVLAGFSGAALAVLPLPWALRWLALPLLLPMLWPAVSRPAEGRFELVAADFGQGSAVLVRTRGHLLLYDTGPAWGPDSDAGQRVLLPLLRARGERRIDTLVLSHRDSDHVGGAAALLAALPVPRLLSGLETPHALHAPRPGMAVQRCASGQRWTWDGVHFEVLHPTEDDRRVADKPNAVSCVLRIEDSHGRAFLLTGDIEAAQEALLVQRHGARLASDGLLLPHHGSRTSSSAPLLDAVQPRTAIVQAAYRSRFGHPATSVLERLTDRRIAVVRTDRCGAWMWHDGAAFCTREVRRRYWHWRAEAGGADVASHDGDTAGGPPSGPPLQEGRKR